MAWMACSLLALVSALAAIGCRGRLTSIDRHAADNAREYDSAPVLWLGDKFDADGDGEPEMPISAFTAHAVNERAPIIDSGLVPVTESVFLAYGQCELPRREGGCAEPIQIVIEPPCGLFPEGAPHIESIRGVETLGFAEGQLTLRAAEFTVTIFAVSNDEAKRIATALYGANDAAAGIAPGSDFTPQPPGYCP